MPLNDYDKDHWLCLVMTITTTPSLKRLLMLVDLRSTAQDRTLLPLAQFWLSSAELKLRTPHAKTYSLSVESFANPWSSAERGDYPLCDCNVMNENTRAVNHRSDFSKNGDVE